jgi:hypothetical protein
MESGSAGIRGAKPSVSVTRKSEEPSTKELEASLRERLVGRTITSVSIVDGSLALMVDDGYELKLEWV